MFKIVLGLQGKPMLFMITHGLYTIFTQALEKYHGGIPLKMCWSFQSGIQGPRGRTHAPPAMFVNPANSGA